MQNMRSLILKVNNNEKVRWEQQFPSIYGDTKFTANNERNVEMAIRELKNIPLTKIRAKAQKMGLMYVISQNEFSGKWGLDKQTTTEGGGVVAQSDSYINCIKRAQDEFGIHPIFIYGVGVDEWD